MENSIYNPQDIIKGKKYVSNMFQLVGYTYMGVREYSNSSNPRMIIVNHEEDINCFIGDLLPNDTDNPIWKNGFRPLD